MNHLVIKQCPDDQRALGKALWCFVTRKVAPMDVYIRGTWTAGAALR